MGNYSADQYINVIVYLVGVTVLFAVIFIFSAWLTNKSMKKELHINKIKSTRKNNKQKQWFFDVA
jgi:cytochrome bd-type quinol oxidase subunit 2